MAWLPMFLPLALEGEWADLRAVGVVLAGVTALIVSIYILLWSNLGARVGYLVLMVSLTGWMIMLSLIWLVGVPGTLPGTGPRTHEPRWVPFLAESEQAQEFAGVIERFPDAWDAIGKTYPGNIESRGEVESATTIIRKALARLAEANGLKATKASQWKFRLKGTEAISEADKKLPETEVFFYQKGTPLLTGVRIPATEEHREITVFALRDKGATYLNALIILLASAFGFAVHLWLLARHERKQKASQTAEAFA